MDPSMPRRIPALAAALLLSLPTLLWAGPASAQENLPWLRDDPRYSRPDDGYASDRYGRPSESNGQRSRTQDQPQDEAYRPPRGYGQQQGTYTRNSTEGYYDPNSSTQRYGEPYRAYNEDENYDRRYDPRPYSEGSGGTYSSNEILSTGHGFFGSISKGLASVVEYAFQKQGRPNGYILGQDAGGAFVAGLRYGEGVLHTKDAGTHRVFWQGPSIGYDAGAEGSKVMILVYNLTHPEDIYQRFGGVDGSAYVVGGIGLTFQKNGDMVAAPIRAGVGLRLGANVGYLKYTRKPTWNPF